MTKVGVIYGSSRPSKAGKGIAQWFEGAVSVPDGVELQMIDLAEVNLPFLADPLPPMMQQYELESTKQWSEQIAELDSFIIIMSEYNSGYAPILKNAIDTLYNEWGGKKVAVISYGAGSTSNAAKQFREVLNKIKMDVSDTETHIHSIHDAQNQDGSLNEEYLSGSPAQEVFDSVV